MRRGILSEHLLGAILELESELSLRGMRVGGPSESELEFCRVNGGVDSGLLFPGEACFGIFIWVMENIRWSALAGVSCLAVVACDSLSLLSGLVFKRRSSMFTWSSSAWEISSSCLSR